MAARGVDGTVFQLDDLTDDILLCIFRQLEFARDKSIFGSVSKKYRVLMQKKSVWRRVKLQGTLRFLNQFHRIFKYGGNELECIDLVSQEFSEFSLSNMCKAAERYPVPNLKIIRFAPEGSITLKNWTVKECTDTVKILLKMQDLFQKLEVIDSGILLPIKPQTVEHFVYDINGLYCMRDTAFRFEIRRFRVEAFPNVMTAEQCDGIMELFEKQRTIKYLRVDNVRTVESIPSFWPTVCQKGLQSLYVFAPVGQLCYTSVLANACAGLVHATSLQTLYIHNANLSACALPTQSLVKLTVLGLPTCELVGDYFVKSLPLTLKHLELSRTRIAETAELCVCLQRLDYVDLSGITGGAGHVKDNLAGVLLRSLSASKTLKTLRMITYKGCHEHTLLEAMQARGVTLRLVS